MSGILNMRMTSRRHESRFRPSQKYVSELIYCLSLFDLRPDVRDEGLFLGRREHLVHRFRPCRQLRVRRLVDQNRPFSFGPARDAGLIVHFDFREPRILDHPQQIAFIEVQHGVAFGRLEGSRLRLQLVRSLPAEAASTTGVTSRPQ